MDMDMSNVLLGIAQCHRHLAAVAQARGGAGPWGSWRGRAGGWQVGQCTRCWAPKSWNGL